VRPSIRILATSLSLALALSLGGAGRASAEPSAADCLAASEASIKLDNEHRLRAENEQLLLCASAHCPVDVRNECVRRVDEVVAAIPTIIFEAKDQAGADVSAVTVTMDGEVLVTRLEGIPIQVDPGVHVFTFEVASQPVVRKSFVIRQGQQNRSELITFKGADAPPAAVSAPAPVVSLAPVSARREADVTVGAQRTLAIVVASVGGVALGVGTVFGLQAMTKRDAADRACPTATCANQSGADMWHDARRSGDISTAAFAVGGVALTSAVILWLTGRPGPVLTASAVARPDEASFALSGRW
jgi:hypothetical protein